MKVGLAAAGGTALSVDSPSGRQQPGCCKQALTAQELARGGPVVTRNLDPLAVGQLANMGRYIDPRDNAFGIGHVNLSLMNQYFP